MEHDLRINITARSVMIEWMSPETGIVEMFRIDVPQLPGSSIEIIGDLSDNGAELDVTINSPVMPVTKLPPTLDTYKLA